MSWLFVLCAMLVFLFGFVVAFGAPYLPTLQPRTQDALQLLSLKPGQTMLELGCGDGRVLRAAAQQGIRGVGYELNPLLVLFARLVTWRYRKLVTVRWANYWQVSLPACDGIYVFLLDRYMTRLDDKIKAEIKPPVRLVSFAFEIPGKKHAKHKNGLFLYMY
ncbi:class I SAM-dependent methyltransferase [Candidatus Saccharibacteria bacterium]|nr:class I SAM-dependent methyltransferase [Candidatus Saccharibacteria bacterium]